MGELKGIEGEGRGKPTSMFALLIPILLALFLSLALAALSEDAVLQEPSSFEALFSSEQPPSQEAAP